jgi:glc operon protein GlcG
LSDNGTTLHWSDVDALLQAAQRSADGADLRVVVAVVDRAGNLAGFLRHPDAFPSSSSVAVAKAFTASNFRAATADMAERIPPERRAELGRQESRLIFLAGGLPIVREGVALGGIGVSGATSEEDTEIAVAALAALDRLPERR